MKRLKKQNEYRWDLIPNASGPAGLFLTLSHNLEGSDHGTDRTNPYSKGTDPPCSSAPSYWHSLGTRGAGDLLVLSSSHGCAHLSQLCASVAPWCWWHPTNRHVPCHGRQTLVWFIPVKTRNNYGNETPPFQHKTALPTGTIILTATQILSSCVPEYSLMGGCCTIPEVSNPCELKQGQVWCG